MINTAIRVVLCTVATAIGAALAAVDLHADEWTDGDFGNRREWRAPAVDPARFGSLMRRELRGLNRLDEGELDRVVARVQQFDGISMLRTGRAEGDRAFSGDLRDYVQKIVGGQDPISNRSGQLDALRSSRVGSRAEPINRFILREAAAVRAESIASDPLRLRAAERPSLLETLRIAGFSLRRLARQPVGFKDPATLSYFRDLKTKEDAFQIEFGLTWRSSNRISVFGGNQRSGVPATIRPSAWASAHLTTAAPTDENFWGGGAGLEFDWDCRSVCSGICRGTTRVKLTLGADWGQSQDGNTEKLTAWLAIDPVIADLGLGWRRPIGTYGSAPLSFAWNASARFDFGRTLRTGTTMESAKEILRGTGSATATLYLDALGRALRGRSGCPDDGTECAQDAAKKHDPYLQAQWSGYWLADQSRLINWFRASFVVPIPGNEGLTLEVAYENGAQAPLSFKDSESIAAKLGVRF